MLAKHYEEIVGARGSKKRGHLPTEKVAKYSQYMSQ